MSWLNRLQEQCKACTRPMLVLRANGTVEVRDNSGYQAVRDGVGGDIERVELRIGTLWCHEQGRMLGMAPNWLASELAEQSFGPDALPIVGDCVLVGAETMPDPTDLECEPEDGPVGEVAIFRVATLLARLEMHTCVWFQGGSHA